jgi:copper(I)-binding protein
MQNLRFIFGLSVVALLLGVTSAATLAESSAFPATVVISEPWIRANAPGLDVAAAYFNIRNSGKQAIVLSAVGTPAAASATMHMTVIAKGVSSMRELASVRIDAGETVKFEPGGMHVMLLGLRHPLQPGRSAALRFTLSSGASLQLNATIKPLAGL